jgi:hypothetical protein
MSKLKDINLSDLGIKKNILTSSLEKLANYKPTMEFSRKKVDSLAYSEVLNERKRSSPYYFEKEGKERINNSSNMNSKFLQHINIIENIKGKPGQYLDKRAEWEKDLEAEEFTPPTTKPSQTITLTFRKFFYQTFAKNITEFALKNPEKLPTLVEKVRNDIQKNAQAWLDFVTDKQISTLLCQIDNYSAKGKIFKKSSEFQNIPTVIQSIIDTNLKMRYESSDWNKDGAKTSSKERENLLIIDASLFQNIETYEVWESRQEKEKRKTPLPLHQVWNQFASVITFPLKNNFQFAIIDQRVLVGWQDFQKLEIKYDETNSMTYFCRKMEGGFKQLTHYNAVAFISVIEL